MKLVEVAEFIGRSTNGVGKTNASAWAANITKFQRDRNLCIYLVGDVSGLQRHIDEKRRLGFTDLGTHIIVERAPNTARALREALNELASRNPEYAKIRCVHGDIVTEAHRHPVGSISHLDFDTASSFDRRMLATVIQLCSLEIDNIHLVFDQRANPAEIEALWPRERDPETRLGGKYESRKRGGVMKHDIPPAQHTILTRILKAYLMSDYEVSETLSYPGKRSAGKAGSSMMMVVLNRW
jgi:hypothetical protein